MQAADDTTRRLLFGAAATVTATYDATPRAAAAPLAAAPPQPHAASAEDEAEAALRYLEAEWTMQLDAPLTALAGLEDTLSRAIDDAARHLPYPPPEVPSGR